MSAPLIMGVLNVTPDSFSDGGHFNNIESACAHAAQMLHAGADWIDVGGESTRPGAHPVPADQELQRVVPVINEIRSAFPDAQISIDTSRPIVAREAIRVGASLINDVRAGTADEQIFTVAAECNVPMILMHMQGSPETMQQQPEYGNVVHDVAEYLARRVSHARSEGVPRVYVDPGIGFGKTLEHNLALLESLDVFADVADGVVLGISRKRFIGAITGIADAQERDVATALIHALLWAKPVHMIRVHNVQLHAMLRTIASAVRG